MFCHSNDNGVIVLVGLRDRVFIRVEQFFFSTMAWWEIELTFCFSFSVAI